MLNRDAVAAILKVKAKTISQYLVESRPPGKYATHPFPKPDGYIGRGPWWLREREAELLTWATTRRGQGIGGGRPRKTRSNTQA